MTTDIQEQPTPSQKSDWSIGALYQQAWTIIKNNKVLWLFGLAAGGLEFNTGNFDFNNVDISKLQKLFEKSPEHTSQLSRVLGDTTSVSAEIVKYIFSPIPQSLYIILGIEMLFLIVISVTLSLIYQNWATGALLEGIQTCMTGGKATIADAARKAYRHIKPLLWLNLVPGLLLALIAFSGITLLTLGLIFGPGIIKILAGIGIFIFVMSLLFASILLTLTTIWAQRSVVVEHAPARQAFWTGMRIARRKKWSMILLGVINTIVTGAALVLLIVAFVALVVVGIFAGITWKSVIWLLFLLGIPLFLGFIILLTTGGGMVQAFKATVWSLAYEKIRGKYN